MSVDQIGRAVRNNRDRPSSKYNYVRLIISDDTEEVFFGLFNFRRDTIIIPIWAYVYLFLLFLEVNMMSADITIDDEFDDVGYIKAHLEGDGAFLEWIPDRFKTYEICKYAIEQDYVAIKFTPKTLLDGIVTEQMCWEMLKLNVLNFELVPDQFKTSEMCEYALNSPWNIVYVPNPTKEQLFAAVENDGEGIGFCGLDAKHQSNELCVLAINKDPSNLRGVKRQKLSLCYLAVKQCDCAYWYIRNPLFLVILFPVFFRQYIKSSKKDYLSMESYRYADIDWSYYSKKTRLKMRIDRFFRRLIWKHL